MSEELLRDAQTRLRRAKAEAIDAPLNLLLGTLGFKFNPRAAFIISAHLLFSLNDQGLQSRMSVVIGADYTFGTDRIQGPSASRR